MTAGGVRLEKLIWSGRKVAGGTFQSLKLRRSESCGKAIYGVTVRIDELGRG